MSSDEALDSLSASFSFFFWAERLALASQTASFSSLVAVLLLRILFSCLINSLSFFFSSFSDSSSTSISSSPSVSSRKASIFSSLVPVDILSKVLSSYTLWSLLGYALYFRMCHTNTYIGSSSSLTSITANIPATITAIIYLPGREDMAQMVALTRPAKPISTSIRVIPLNNSILTLVFPGISLILY